MLFAWLLETTTGVDTISEDDPGAEDTEGNADLVRYIPRVDLLLLMMSYVFLGCLKELMLDIWFSVLRSDILLFGP